MVTAKETSGLELSRKNNLTRAVLEALEARTLLSATLSGTTLNVTGTSAADTFTLSDDGTTITVKQNATTYTFADSSVSKIVVNPSAGGDTVNLLSNTRPITITGGGLDAVNIGDTGSLSNISAAVSVGNPSSFTNLTVDGSNDAFGTRTGVLSATVLSGLSDGAITYTAARLSAFTISSGDEFLVNNTGVLHNSVPTVINGGSSTIGETTGPLDFNISNFGNQFFLGANHSMQGIKGALDINTDPTVGADLHIDDSGDTVGRTVTVSGFIDITGVSPAPIKCENVEADSDFFMSLGKGNDKLTIAGSADDGDNDYDLGAGNDLVNFYNGGIVTNIVAGAGNDTLDAHGNGFLGSFDGGTGTNTVIVDASQNTQYGEYIQASQNTIGDGIDGNTSLSNIQIMSLIGSPFADYFDVDPNTNIPLTIHGGGGDDTIFGGAKNDVLYGDAGNDVIYGNGGNDTIFGGDGNDSLNGNAGTDSLTGGSGSDTMNDGEDEFVHIISDNIGGATTTGSWVSSTSNSGFYNTNYLTDNNSGKGTKSVTFAATIPIAGPYQVYARWTAAPNRANHVPIDVTHKGVTSTVFVNQQQSNNAWVLLGTYDYSGGETADVTIRNTGTTGYVIADAVRLIPVNVTGSITGNVFNDINGNGIQDPGEGPSTHGAVMYIDANQDGLLDDNEVSTTVDSSGNYTFSGLGEGVYRIRYQNNSGYRQTAPAARYIDVNLVTAPTHVIDHLPPFADQVFTPSPAAFTAINAGDGDFILNSGETFRSDTDFSGGTAISSPYDVAGTDNDPLYYSYRSGSSAFSYSVPVPSGVYSVVVWFADPTSTAAGQREFNVTAMGQPVLTNFDIYAAAGAPKTAVSESFTVTTNIDAINLTFTPVVGDAIVSAIAFYPIQIFT